MKDSIIDEIKTVREWLLESLIRCFGWRAAEINISMFPCSFFQDRHMPLGPFSEAFIMKFKKPLWAWCVGTYGHFTVCGYAWYALHETGMVLRVGTDRALFCVTDSWYDGVNELDVDCGIEGFITGFNSDDLAWARLQICVSIDLATHPRAYQFLELILEFNKDLLVEAEAGLTWMPVARKIRRILGIAGTPEKHIRELVNDLARQAGDAKVQRALRTLSLPLNLDGFALLCYAAHLPGETIENLTAEFRAGKKPQFSAVPLGRWALLTDVTPDMAHAPWVIEEDIQNHRNLEVFDVCRKAFGHEEDDVFDNVDFRQLRAFLAKLRTRCRVIDALTQAERQQIVAAADRVARAVAQS